MASAPLSVFRGFVPKDPLRAAPLGAGSRPEGGFKLSVKVVDTGTAPLAEPQHGDG
ncbi:hypothetical protein KL86PLE_60047 [uncultured Pleomorphomonas sp.]|uniref:Uncharacterized protein n=1 Tax=uncultured Pleomorphomonas sp. TaxID=442121 RepID=A0A212LJL7_9HYPH|nr:hypothetical protein KL86PLE_60047 [uncultured Pleomorphomonas sp.]